jgi:hypothetical protein
VSGAQATSHAREYPKPCKPTDAQIMAFLRNRNRRNTPATRAQARVELAALERKRLVVLSDPARRVRRDSS